MMLLRYHIILTGLEEKTFSSWDGCMIHYEMGDDKARVLTASAPTRTACLNLLMEMVNENEKKLQIQEDDGDAD